MNLSGWPPGRLLVLFGALAALVTLLYGLRLRRRRLSVPFLPLWEQILSERPLKATWSRLRWPLSLLLQLVFIVLVVFALGDPRLSDRYVAGRHIVLLIDVSASMQASDSGGPARIEAAIRAGRAVIRSMRARDRLMLVTLGQRATPLSPFTSDVKRLLALLAELHPSDTPADLRGALAFSAAALRGRTDPLLVLVSDGAYEPAPLREFLEAGSRARSAFGAPIETRFVPVGHSRNNVGIVAFSARRDAQDDDGLALFLEVANHRVTPVRLDLRVLVDGVLIDVRRLDVAGQERARYACDGRVGRGDSQGNLCDLRSSGQVIEVRLAPHRAAGSPPPAPRRLDDFALDDRAFAVVPSRPRLRALLVTEGNFFLEGALLLLENVELERISPAAYDSAQVERYDVVVLDGFVPAARPSPNAIWFNPPPGSTRFVRPGVIEDPLVTEQDDDHPVMRDITLKDMNVLRATKLRPRRGDVVLASCSGEPLILARDHGSRRDVIFGFDAKASDLPLRIAFPLLLLNALHWFGEEREAERVSHHPLGQLWHVPLAGGGLPTTPGHALVIDPTGARALAPVHRGVAFVAGERVGVHELQRAGKVLRIAGNLADLEESNIRPRAQRLMREHAWQAPHGLRSLVRRELWLYLIVAALGLIGIEWLTYNRRITV